MLQDIQKRTALFDGSQASPAFPSDNSSIKIKMVMGYLWYDPNSEPKYTEKNLSQYHFVIHKSHMHWPAL